MIPAVSAATGGGAAGLPYQWVAVGTSGTLYTSTSTTASSWTSRTSSFGTSAINCVASNGLDLYVAAGVSGKLATSPDGITWTQRTSSFGTASVSGVAYGNGYWVIVGNNLVGTNYLAYSTNGTTWTQNTTTIAAANNINSVEYGNGVWVVTALGGDVWTATDPTGTWTNRSSTLLTGGTQQNLNHYAKTQGVYIQGSDGGTTGAFQSSTNGTTYTSRNSALNVEQQSGAFTSNSTIIVWGGALSGGTTTDIQTTTDGITWTDRTPAVTATVVRSAASDPSDLLVLMSSSSGGQIQTSTNGTTWTNQGTIAAGFVGTNLCHSSGKPAIR